jgi:hypothetical protein
VFGLIIGLNLEMYRDNYSYFIKVVGNLGFSGLTLKTALNWDL